MSLHTPQFHLDGYKGASRQVEDRFFTAVEVSQIDLRVLAEHHAPDSRHSYYVLHDRSVTWGIPGEPQLVALHLQRDTGARTFRFDSTELPLPVMAQSWLIARGCPTDAIRLQPGAGTAPADDTTRALEARLVGDGDHFALLISYTDDISPECPTTVMLRAVDERSPKPFRVLLEQSDMDAGTHTLREGGFDTFHAVTQWWEAYWSGDGVPLPAPPPAARPAVSPAVPAPAPAATKPPRR
ncbi:hypothetical protein [Streptomyces niveus]|uniref:hypothetical protein n=1 Tax=Streptomyces niveus TaxID=193462 RepID=UPI0003C5DE88|nr:hypothetical protein [Streptomyces niveus]EST31761.1 hypothetical protein M877_06385 [Streptomyces niveus NCIMB 11891]